MEIVLPLIAGGLIGFFAVLFAQAGDGTGKKDRDRKDKCDGDCVNCPDHFGFRHGKWHLGRGHDHGCERDGNGGSTGQCHRD